jgi:hypothetical protein
MFYICNNRKILAAGVTGLDYSEQTGKLRLSHVTTGVIYLLYSKQSSLPCLLYLTIMFLGTLAFPLVQQAKDK